MYTSTPSSSCNSPLPPTPSGKIQPCTPPLLSHHAHPSSHPQKVKEKTKQKTQREKQNKKWKVQQCTCEDFSLCYRFHQFCSTCSTGHSLSQHLQIHTGRLDTLLHLQHWPQPVSTPADTYWQTRHSAPPAALATACLNPCSYTLVD